MINQELYQLYEKLYFQEIEIRDRLIGRLILPMTILISLIGFLGYMFKGIYSIEYSIYGIMFIILYVCSIVFAVLSVMYFFRAFYGYEFAYIPLAKSTEDYKETLNQHYNKYANRDELVFEHMNKYLYDSFMMGASINAEQNYRRTINISKTNKFIMVSIIFTFFSFLFFSIGILYQNNAKLIQNVRIIEPITIKSE